jgi:hypothetical protein
LARTFLSAPLSINRKHDSSIIDNHYSTQQKKVNSYKVSQPSIRSFKKLHLLTRRITFALYNDNGQPHRSSLELARFYKGKLGASQTLAQLHLVIAFFSRTLLYVNVSRASR